MKNVKKVDNKDLPSKLELRRWLLHSIGVSDVSVLDTCAGAGHVWNGMRAHVNITKWVRCDIKPRQAGTLQMTAMEAVKALPLSEFNVIDIDPYGDPFGPYLAALQRITQPTTFFLTHGHIGHGQMSNESVSAAGIPLDWNYPRTPTLSAYFTQRTIEATWLYADVVVAGEVLHPHVDYYGIHVTPNNGTHPSHP